MEGLEKYLTNEQNTREQKMNVQKIYISNIQEGHNFMDNTENIELHIDSRETALPVNVGIVSIKFKPSHLHLVKVLEKSIKKTIIQLNKEK